MLALAALEEDPEVDVIIIARGGGSLEDLLSFSDEGLVRAVSAARTPIITAIGHERDSPIVDLVADVRASTPTDAAKLVVPDHAQESAGVAEARARLNRAIDSRLADLTRQLSDLRSRPVMVNPTSAFDAHVERLSFLRHRLQGSIDALLRSEDATLRASVGSIRALSPKRTLERGYAVLVDATHTSVFSVDDAAPQEAGSAPIWPTANSALDVVEQTKKEPPQHADEKLTYEAARDELVEVVRKSWSPAGRPWRTRWRRWQRGEKLAEICQGFLDGAKEQVSKQREAVAKD